MNAPSSMEPGSWRDTLVELHVLAEHGDAKAAADAAHWLDRDADARQMWDEVQATCDAVRRRERAAH
jgi:hypothetical protein